MAQPINVLGGNPNFNPAANSLMPVQASRISQPRAIGQNPGFDPRNPKLFTEQGGVLGGIRPTMAMQGGLTEPQAMQPQTVQSQQPQAFGLSGSEQALQAGVQGAGQALQTGQQQALDTLGLGSALVGQQLQQGRQDLTQGALAGLGLAQGGLSGALGQLQQGRQALSGNFNASASTVNPLTGQPLFMEAAQGVGAFSPAGLQAQNLQSALSGAQGQQAFDQALINNPLQNFLNQRGQQALVDQAASTGGLGSGQFQSELQQLGQAQAGQQLQQQIANLQALSGQGLQAAGQQGQFLSQAGQQQGNLAAQNAQLGTQANIASASNRLGAAQGQANLFGQGAQAFQRGGEFGANLLGQAAGQRAGLAGQGAGIFANLAGQGAGIQTGTGQNIANLLSGTAQQISQGRTQAGRDLASQIGSTTSQLSQLASQQGGGLSDIIGAGGGNLANLLSGAGQLTAGQQTQLAQLLSNLAVGEGSQLTNLAGQIGQAQAGGITGSAGATKDTALRLATLLSDERLKDNISKIGESNGFNIYSWTWNKLMPFRNMVGKISIGVVAQEVEQIIPDAISKHESGFKQVDYSMLGVING